MDLTDRVEIWTRTLTRSATGHTAGPWVLQRVIWGRLIPLDVSNQARYQQRGHTRVTHEILVNGRLEFQLDATEFRVNGQALRPLETGQQSGRRSSVRIPVLEVA